jgi:hypothetical protein
MGNLRFSLALPALLKQNQSLKNQKVKIRQHCSVCRIIGDFLRKPTEICANKVRPRLGFKLNSKPLIDKFREKSAT